MNKEKLFRYFILVFIMFFLIDFFYLKLFFPVAHLYAFAAFVFWVLFEAYLRIQHNVDNKFLRLGNFVNEEKAKINNYNRELLEKIERIGRESVYKMNHAMNESVGKFFIMKSDLEFRLLGLRQKMEERDNFLEEHFKNMAEELNSLKAELENIREGIKKVNVRSISLFRLSEILWIEARKKSLYQIAPDIFNFRTVLYIGASKERSQFLEEFLKEKYSVTILEAFEPNAEYWKFSEAVEEVINGDVRNYDFNKKFDVVFWWHGPEHIKEDELSATLLRLESFAERILALGCPWGKYNQAGGYGNEFEQHQSFYNEGYFEKLGFKTNYLGRRDVPGSNICAVKYIK